MSFYHPPKNRHGPPIGAGLTRLQTDHEQGEIGRTGAGVRLQQEVGIRVRAFFRPGQLQAGNHHGRVQGEGQRRIGIVGGNDRHGQLLDGQALSGGRGNGAIAILDGHALLSSAWANVASVADSAQESSQPFRVTSSRVRRAKKDGNSAPAARDCASTPKVTLNGASRDRGQSFFSERGQFPHERGKRRQRGACLSS